MQPMRHFSKTSLSDQSLIKTVMEDQKKASAERIATGNLSFSKKTEEKTSFSSFFSFFFSFLKRRNNQKTSLPPGLQYVFFSYGYAGKERPSACCESGGSFLRRSRARMSGCMRLSQRTPRTARHGTPKKRRRKGRVCGPQRTEKNALVRIKDRPQEERHTARGTKKRLQKILKTFLR